MKNRLKELIEEKYGADRFEFGCEMVAQFVEFEISIKTHWNQVEHWAHNQSAVWDEAEEALRSLFKLKSVEELYQP